ncbi:MAG TPA: hypothetical protein VNM92_00735 [Thermoanaerobaculia bacterium]|nr:hypothetical protein [Thermoanaerobaculia bacterium]
MLVTNLGKTGAFSNQITLDQTPALGQLLTSLATLGLQVLDRLMLLSSCTSTSFSSFETPMDGRGTACGAAGLEIGYDRSDQGLGWK